MGRTGEVHVHDDFTPGCFSEVCISIIPVHAYVCLNAHVCNNQADFYSYSVKNIAKLSQLFQLKNTIHILYYVAVKTNSKMEAI